MGRPPVGKAAMTNAERQRKFRARNARPDLIAHRSSMCDFRSQRKLVEAAAEVDRLDSLWGRMVSTAGDALQILKFITEEHSSQLDEKIRRKISMALATAEGKLESADLLRYRDITDDDEWEEMQENRNTDT